MHEVIAALQSSWERSILSGTLEKPGSSGQTLQVHMNGTALAWRRFLNSGNSYNFHKYVMWVEWLDVSLFNALIQEEVCCIACWSSPVFNALLSQLCILGQGELWAPKWVFVSAGSYVASSAPKSFHPRSFPVNY